MKDFKDSTKVCYVKGGPVGIKGAAKTAQVLSDFKKGAEKRAK